MTVKKKRTKWLHFCNKALSGVLFLLGFGSSSEENEMDEVIPMYGMPASIYKEKAKKNCKEESPELNEIIHDVILKRKQHA